MKRVSRKPQTQKTKSGNVRIISGQYRGRKLPVADVDGLRPTTDRNKETLFNWLMHDLPDAHCLDAFAGSGGLGFEALSRYAGYCTFIEKDRNVANQLKTNLSTLSASGEVINGDAVQVLSTTDKQFDIIFIDPPFNKGLVEPVLKTILDRNLLKPDGVIYVEQEISAPSPLISERLQVVKEKKLAQVMYCLLSLED